VKGTPSWVHFGDGKDVFDTQLTPGRHKLALQLGDDLHNTMPGLHDDYGERQAVEAFDTTTPRHTPTQPPR
jgi:hypothetical protein